MYPLRSLVPALHFCIHRGAKDLGPLAQWLLLLLPLPPALELSGLGGCCLSSGANPWSTQGLPGWGLSILLKFERKLFPDQAQAASPLGMACVPGPSSITASPAFQVLRPSCPGYFHGFGVFAQTRGLLRADSPPPPGSSSPGLQALTVTPCPPFLLP